MLTDIWDYMRCDISLLAVPKFSYITKSVTASCRVHV